MPKGKRKFVVEITETFGLTELELNSALMRLAGGLQSGRNSIEKGILRDSKGLRIGTYKWVDQIQPPRAGTEPGE
jgi:hypothetical protein